MTHEHHEVVTVPVTVEDRERYAQLAAEAQAAGFNNLADQRIAALGAEALTVASTDPGMDNSGLKDWATQITQENGEQ
jgi:predicted nucleic acid-binding protein